MQICKPKLRCNLQVIIFLGQGLCCSLFKLSIVLLHQVVINLDFRRSKGGCSDELEVGVANQLTGKPQERLLKVVVGLGRDIIVLQVLLAVEGDSLGLDLTLLDIDLVTAKNNWDVFADTDKITMPVGNVLVCDTGGDIEHDDGTLTLDAVVTNQEQFSIMRTTPAMANPPPEYVLVTITETSELFLTGSIPGVEHDGSKVGVEGQRMDLNTKSSCKCVRVNGCSGWQYHTEH
jgi:hypothetical protein